MKPLILTLLAAATLAAQPVQFGAKAGVPLTDFISAAQQSPAELLSAAEHPQRYLLGPTVEVKLPFSLAFEADVLYRRVNFQTQSTGARLEPTTVVTSNDWEFPLLLKYRFRGMKFVRPYADAGVAFDRLQGLANAVVLTSSVLKNSGTTGAVAGAGLDFHFLMLHVAPEVRYTRWTSAHFNLAGVLASQQNQAEFMVGITF